MEGLMAIVIGVLFAAGLFLMLRRSLLRLILGVALMSHAVNMLIFVMGGLRRGGIPVGAEEELSGATDPLVQALILTAIVISFGVTALFLVVAYRAHQEHGTDDLDEMRELKG
ncbi:MAG: Na(+)/H(+) antiporter subunit C [Chloroflexota bacterium]|nr:Na(+)/H(+) antiporter subunit C [Chloroflexota bacterium]